MGKSRNRFICVYSESSFTRGTLRVLVDRETRVNYLWCKDGYGGGLTPLLGSDGKPVITPRGALPED